MAKWLPVLVCLLGAGSGAESGIGDRESGQDKPKRKLAWLLPKTRVAEYAVLGPGGKPIADRAVWVFGSELREDGTNRILVDRYADIPLALLFHLPAIEVKPGDAWEHSAFFFHEASYGSSDGGGRGWGGMGWGGGGGSIRPCCARGKYTFQKIDKDKKTDEELAIVAGDFILWEIKQDNSNNERKLVVTKNDLGTVNFTFALSLTRGVLVRATTAVKTRAQERLPVKEDTKVLEKRLTVSESLELKEEVDLDPEKMAKAIEAQLKKAADWMRKSEWGSMHLLEQRTRQSVPGLWARALLAAGAKPDEPAVQRAMQAVRAQPPQTPYGLAHNLAAFVYRACPTGKAFAEIDLGTARADLRKALPKADLDAIRAFANALLAQRDSKSTWPVAPKESTNILTTRHALEGLALASEAGVDVPNDVWTKALDLLIGTMAEEGAEIELAYEGVDFPDKDGAKKVRPAGWRFDIADPDSKGSGNAFTTCAAAEMLKLCEIELTRRGLLKDAQKRGLDRCQRGALAWIQARKTWRTPPPTESDSNVRKVDHVYLTSRVLALYGAKKIDGADWHLEAAYHLMRQQFDDGHWDCGYGYAGAETAQAALVLARGVLRPSPVK